MNIRSDNATGEPHPPLQRRRTPGATPCRSRGLRQSACQQGRVSTVWCRAPGAVRRVGVSPQVRNANTCSRMNSDRRAVTPDAPMGLVCRACQSVPFVYSTAYIPSTMCAASNTVTTAGVTLCKPGIVNEPQRKQTEHRCGIGNSKRQCFIGSQPAQTDQYNPAAATGSKASTASRLPSVSCTAFSAIHTNSTFPTLSAIAFSPRDLDPSRRHIRRVDGADVSCIGQGIVESCARRSMSASVAPGAVTVADRRPRKLQARAGTGLRPTSSCQRHAVRLMAVTYERDDHLRARVRSRTRTPSEATHTAVPSCR